MTGSGTRGSRLRESLAGEMDSPNDSNSHTEYDKMILRMDKEIKPYYFGLAGFFSWLLLAGFLVSPTTYSSVRYIDAPKQTGDIGKAVMYAVRNIPLIFIASFACIIAAVGLAWLWTRWHHNHIWVHRYLVIPTMLHSLMGLISTLLNVYGTQEGQWSITAIISVAIIGTCLISSTTAYVTYEYVLLPKLK
ncbi:hypothetical protein PLICBS_001176 [Purpureocillium lilacinum]|uniref:uncharacterized protein n=1 Tax=Purpureocillium lilacinum TaxID=33203 RepID=UPI0020839700|nr:hypothetical protein PLICBS_001176 [Purpureocillium lilacinum]